MFHSAGYAVFDSKRKKVFINSAHFTKQGAMVNGLLLCFNFITPQHFTYEQIRNVWLHKTTGTSFTIVSTLIVTDGVEQEV